MAVYSKICQIIRCCNKIQIEPIGKNIFLISKEIKKMNEIKNYFGSLQKYFNTNETLSFSQTPNSLTVQAIRTKHIPPKLIKSLRKNKNLFEPNFRRALTKVFPKLNPDSFNIKYVEDGIIGSVKKFTYFDMIPQEMVVEIASYLNSCQEIFGLANILDIPVESVTNRVIQNLMPDLYRWIVSNHTFSCQEYQEFKMLYKNLNKSIMDPMRAWSRDPEKQKYETKLVRRDLKDFLLDTTTDIQYINNYFENLKNIDTIYLIKMRQFYPHFKNVENEMKFSKDLYRLLYEYEKYDSTSSEGLGRPHRELLNYIKTGKLESPLTDIAMMDSGGYGWTLSYFAYNLLTNPNIKIEDCVIQAKLMKILFEGFDRELFKKYAQTLKPADIDKIIKCTATEFEYYDFIYYLNMINNLSPLGKKMAYQYLLEFKYPKLADQIRNFPYVEDIIPNLIDISEIIENYLNSDSTGLYKIFNNYINTGYLEPTTLPSKIIDIEVPRFLYLLLNNPNLRLPDHETYIRILRNLSNNKNLLNDYLSKLNKEDIKRNLEYLKSKPSLAYGEDYKYHVLFDTLKKYQ